MVWTVRYFSVHALDFSGSWADGSVIAQYMPYILEQIGECKIVVYQGFPRSGVTQNVLVSLVSRQNAERLHPLV